MTPFAFSVVAIICVALLGCSSGPSCVAALPTGCTPLYSPTFDNLYTNTLHATCAQNGASCHSSAGHMAGLIYDQGADTAYALLLGTGGRTAYVSPSDPSCSIVVERLESSDPSLEMPPGMPLIPTERCVFIQWIAQGAKR